MAAFVGALVSTLVLYRIATREGRTSIAMFLLGGLAIAALANAGLGLLVFLADDRQLRDINFWMLGSLSGATWAKVGAIAPFLAGALLAVPFIARGLDLLVLGETEAFQRNRRRTAQADLHRAGGGGDGRCRLGVRGDRLRRHRRAAPAAAADRPGPPLAAAGRRAARRGRAADRRHVRAHPRAPAELPIGIVTAVIGAPFFLYLLLRQRPLLGP